MFCNHSEHYHIAVLKFLQAESVILKSMIQQVRIFTAKLLGIIKAHLKSL